MKITVTRYHDFSMGHSVSGHHKIDPNSGRSLHIKGPCYNFHGHNYRIHFTIEGDQLDSLGRVLDFGAIKALLCTWLEDNWDHKFLIWENDARGAALKSLNDAGVILVPFNPTAENMGDYLINVVAPQQLKDTGCRLIKVVIEETRKCSAEVSI